MKPEPQHRRIPRAQLLVAALVSGVFAFFFGLLYFTLYWPYRGLYNEEGRYFDGHDLVVYHEQASLLMVPAIVFLAVALVFLAAWLFRRRREA